MKAVVYRYGDDHWSREGHLTGCILVRHRMCERHVIKPVSIKQSELTVYFVSDTVGVLSHNARGIAA
jgi:hypothetical protein